jgi:hypothetical protein
VNVPELADDPRIADHENLYRGIHRDQLKRDGSISSGAFCSRTNPHPSVDRSALSTPAQALSRRPHSAGIAQVLAATARQITVGVRWDPRPANQAHSVIIRDRAISDGRWKKQCRDIARACNWALKRRG